MLPTLALFEDEKLNNKLYTLVSQLYSFAEQYSIPFFLVLGTAKNDEEFEDCVYTIEHLPVKTTTASFLMKANIVCCKDYSVSYDPMEEYDRVVDSRKDVLLNIAPKIQEQFIEYIDAIQDFVAEYELSFYYNACFMAHEDDASIYVGSSLVESRKNLNALIGIYLDMMSWLDSEDVKQYKKLGFNYGGQIGEKGANVFYDAMVTGNVLSFIKHMIPVIIVFYITCCNN